MIPNRLVLDTNVLLDLFVFSDPRWDALLAALQSGAVHAVTRTDCRDEWLHVLNYPHLPMNRQTRARAQARFEQLITVMTEAPSLAPPLLPVCSDRDDQKFLELARDTHAAVLVTKDKALLKLAKRTARAGMFCIVTPEAWLRDYGNSTSAPNLTDMPLE